MIINANLNNNTLGLVDLTEPLLLPEKELKIGFKSNVYSLTTLLASAKNGEQGIKQKIIGSTLFDLTSLLFPGTIEMEVSLMSKGEPVKTWRLADIVIKDVNPTYKVIPELSILQEQIDNLKGAIAELTGLLRKNNIIN